jgi:hypothetical protein
MHCFSAHIDFFVISARSLLPMIMITIYLLLLVFVCLSFGCCALLFGLVHYGVDLVVNVVATYLYYIDAFLATSDFQLLLFYFLNDMLSCFNCCLLSVSSSCSLVVDLVQLGCCKWLFSMLLLLTVHADVVDTMCRRYSQFYL